MKKVLLLTLFASAALLWAEENRFTFDDLEGWSVSGAAEIVSDLSVSPTNDIPVSAWHAYGEKALRLEGASAVARSVSLRDDKEQRISFDFYATWPEEDVSRTLVLKLGEVPFLKLEASCTNVISAELYGGYFGDAPEWRPVDGVQTFYHRKWQHIEVLFDRDHILKLKAPNMDAELAGFAFREQLPEGETTFSVESDFEKIYLDNLRFKEETIAHKTLVSENPNVSLEFGQSYELSFARDCSLGGMEFKCALTIPENCLGISTETIFIIENHHQQ